MIDRYYTEQINALHSKVEAEVPSFLRGLSPEALSAVHGSLLQDLKDGRDAEFSTQWLPVVRKIMHEGKSVMGIWRE